MTRWKSHFASIGEPEELQEWQLIRAKLSKLLAVQKLPKRPVVRLTKAQREAREDAYIKALEKKEMEVRRRALDIKVVQPKTESQTGLYAKIYQTLSEAKKPLHITSIIDRVLQLGWTSKSKYHLYAQFQQMLNRHYTMFMRVGRGTYCLRSGFADKPTKQVAAVRKRPCSSSVSSIRDITLTIVKTYAPEQGATPAEVHIMLNNVFGIRCAYSTVYRAMQSDKFKRNGQFYQPASATLPIE